MGTSNRTLMKYCDKTANTNIFLCILFIKYYKKYAGTV